MRRTSGVNENWVKTSTLKAWKGSAKELVERHNIEIKGKKLITIPHPTSPRAVIIKYV